MARKFQVTFDCADPDRLTSFWADALGYRLMDPPAGFDDWPARARPCCASWTRRGSTTTRWCCRTRRATSSA